MISKRGLRDQPAGALIVFFGGCLPGHTRRYTSNIATKTASSTLWRRRWPMPMPKASGLAVASTRLQSVPTRPTHADRRREDAA